MLALLLSGFISLFFFVTLGVYTAKITRLQANLAEKLLLGLVVSNTLVSFISLFFPVNIYVLLVFIGVCSFILLSIKDELKELYHIFYRNSYVLFCALPLILIAFIISLNSPLNCDTGLYHLQSIKWIEEYPVVPGLANLHGRFGFNPNIFTFYALTSFREIFNLEIFSVNLTVLSILVCYIVNKLYSIITRKGFSNLFIFYAVILYALINCSANLSSPSPDFLLQTMSLFIFARMIDISDKSETAVFKNFIPVIFLCVYVVTIKLATLPMLLLPVFIVIKYRSEIRRILLLLPVLCLMILPWLIRNVILTGWLIYPFPLVDLFNFDWKVPADAISREIYSVNDFTKAPAYSSDSCFFCWMHAWWARLNLPDKIVYACSFIFPIIVLIGQSIKKIKIRLTDNAVIITSFIGVLFWLCMAPDFRFGKPFIILSFISPLLLIRFSGLPKKRIKTIFTTIMILLTAVFTLKNLSVIEMNAYKTVHSNLAIVPQSIKIPDDVSFRTFNINGLDIFVPSGHDCFDHCIPCTFFLDTTLVLRGSTLRAGFKHAPAGSGYNKDIRDHIRKQHY
jgi:hypothetical protein